MRGGLAALLAAAACSHTVATAVIGDAPRDAADAQVTMLSRELLDLRFVDGNTLTLLVSAPGAAMPGIYRWPANASEPKRLCALAGRATFSFDGRYVIERRDAPEADVGVFDAHRCRRIARIAVDGRVLDADAHGRWLALATERSGTRRLALHDLRARRSVARPLAETSIGRNVELGFAPDGERVINFDRSDDERGAPTSWSLPRLAPMTRSPWGSRAPAATVDDAAELAFIPGATSVGVYRNGALDLVRWRSGHTLFTQPFARTQRVRALSANARFALVHERTSGGETLQWADFVSGQRITLFDGARRGTAATVDHAALDAGGTAVAWVERDGPDDPRVRLRRASLVRPTAAAAWRIENDGASGQAHRRGIHSRRDAR